jgi:hypothetical protein
MRTPKGARLVWWTLLNAWAKKPCYDGLHSKNTANVGFVFIYQWLGVFCEAAEFACCSEIDTDKVREESRGGSKPCTAVIGEGCSDIVPL